MNTNDLLYEAALIFKELKSYKLDLLVGRKGGSETITLLFDDSEFHHLAGLHKLKDINQVYKQNSKKVYSDIISRQTKLSTIQSSSFFPMIEDRLQIIKSLKSIFKDSQTVFKFRTLKILNSKIPWKFLLEFEYSENKRGYLFLNESRNNPGNYFCVTDFKKEIDYGYSQIKYTLLRVTASNLLTKEKVIWFQSSSYKDI